MNELLTLKLGEHFLSNREFVLLIQIKNLSGLLTTKTDAIDMETQRRDSACTSSLNEHIVRITDPVDIYGMHQRTWFYNEVAPKLAGKVYICRDLNGGNVNLCLSMQATEDSINLDEQIEYSYWSLLKEYDGIYFKQFNHQTRRSFQSTTPCRALCLRGTYLETKCRSPLFIYKQSVMTIQTTLKPV